MDRAEAIHRFASARVARLSTVSGAGRPRVVPVTFVADGKLITMAVDQKPKTTRKLARLDDIETNPSVSVLVDHWSENWSGLWWVRADGTARVIDEAIPDALIAKYSQYTDEVPLGPLIVISDLRWSWWTG